MHICYVADARSPIAKNWISYFVGREHQVTVVSSYPCSPDEIPGARIIQFPFALSSFLSRPRTDKATQTIAGLRAELLSKLRSSKILAASHRIRTWIAPFDVRRKMKALSVLDVWSLELSSEGRRRKVRSLFRADKGHRAEWQAMCDAILSGKESPIPFSEIVATTRATFQMMDSLRSGEPETVESIPIL